MIEHLTTAATQIPVSIHRARAHLRVDLADDDVEIYNAIKDATKAAEEYTGRAFCDQVWTAYYDHFPEILCVLRRPIVSIDSVKYIDIDGNQQTVSSANYRTDLYHGRIVPAYGTSWPNTRSVINSVEVAYTAGYGTNQSPVGVIPNDIQHLILLMVADWMEHKEPTIVGTTVRAIPGIAGVKALLDLNRVYAI
ncbi:MAG: hypothetical protein KJO81_08535 [Gammaproteobacteria bacterium]|nr:hypothetical protein [Gammaproteobacteria bacterium]